MRAHSRALDFLIARIAQRFDSFRLRARNKIKHSSRNINILEKDSSARASFTGGRLFFWEKTEPKSGGFPLTQREGQFDAFLTKREIGRDELKCFYLLVLALTKSLFEKSSHHTILFKYFLDR